MPKLTPLFIIMILAGPLAAQTSDSTLVRPSDVARAYRIAHEAEILNDYARLLAIPNVAADSVNIRENARVIADAFAKLGVTMTLWQQPGAPPLIYGELHTPGATRTLGLYAHYDGQPVDAKDWTTPPWQPVLFTRAIEAGGVRTTFPKAGERVDPEMRLYARSAGDDKAPIQALLTVLRAGVRPTVNIKLLFDGEEEDGSPNLRAYIDEHRARLNDIEGWLFLDGPVHQSRNPLVSFGARGITELDITIYGATRGLHSGHYGNWAPNPALMLAQLLAKMKDEHGHVLIPGFYDSTAPIGSDERAALDALPDYDVALKKELGLVRTDGSGRRLPEVLLEPSLNIRGFTSGNTGAQASNVIPPSATASLDIRLVKGNVPAQMLELVEAFVRAQGYHIVRADPDLATRLAHARIAKIERGTETPAAQSSMNTPLARDVLAAMRTVAGERLLVFPTMGGTLPLHIFTDHLKQPVIVVPTVNHDNRQHAADENLRIANLWYGIELMAALLTF
jgi:acetylornithine deacetylase/succinyl-diaminopimelate desuccinylase-like protein